MSHKDICKALSIKDPSLKTLAFNILEELVKNKFLLRKQYGVYELNKKGTFFKGEIQITAQKAGFVVIDNSEIPDIFIPPSDINHAIGGDLVKVQVVRKKGKRLIGKIVEILKRGRAQFVGTVHVHSKFGFLVPDSTKVGTDIFIPKNKLNGAKTGDKAIAKITVWPESADSPYGEIVEVLGKSGGNDMEMIGILLNQGLEYKFPEEVLSEAEKIRFELDKKELEKRKDFRDIDTFTIDPVDAKDFDDAISFKILENGHFEIGVHIADVSHYVQPRSAMDKEALKRSNSVYLVDRVVPMLPEQLSNIVCSLRPNEDKFTFSAVFEIDENGKIYHEWFGKTVIHSNHRFTYEDAQEIIEGKKGVYDKEIRILDKIAKILRKKRLEKGAMNIESEEVRFKLDENGKPCDVIIKRSKDAHKLIEEFMLLANRSVATFISKRNHKKGKEFPFVYRCHDEPNPEKIALFNLFIRKFGYEIDVTKPKEISKNINKLLNDIRYKNEYSLIQTMAIRSMAKAIYDTENIGHYGLAFKHYTHFTSPIRRYADLIVHRILQEELTKEKHRYGAELTEICKRISRMERRAVDAERESTKYFQTLYVSERVGEIFEGTVSGVAEFGMFVKMNENQCEGMIPIDQIPGDRFRFDPDKFCIIGSKTKKEYNFGDEVTVRIKNVNTEKRQIDLEFIEK